MEIVSDAVVQYWCVYGICVLNGFIMRRRSASKPTSALLLLAFALRPRCAQSCFLQGDVLQSPNVLDNKYVFCSLIILLLFLIMSNRPEENVQFQLWHTWYMKLQWTHQHSDSEAFAVIAYFYIRTIFHRSIRSKIFYWREKKGIFSYWYFRFQVYADLEKFTWREGWVIIHRIVGKYIEHFLYMMMGMAEDRTCIQLWL